MTPDDFIPIPAWHGGNPTFGVVHPADSAFAATVTRRWGGDWAWTVHGRVGSEHGHARRKLAAMWEAIKALEAYRSKCS